MRDSFISKLIKNRVYLLIAIGILLVSLITLGSAYIQSTLSIVGNTKIYKNSWIIHFDDNITPSEDSKTPLVPAEIVDTPWEKIEFGVHLEQPGDIYEFTVDTVNDGTLDAMVDSVETYPFTEEQLKYLEFDVRYDTGEEIKHCDPLYKKDSTVGPNRRKIIATLKFKDDVDLNDYPKEDIDLRIYFKINYVDLDDNCPDPNLKDYHKLTIRPNGGFYERRKAEYRKYLVQGEEYQISTPERLLYNFKGWRVILPEENGTYTLDDDYKFTMGEEDVTIEAIWEEGDYVARIMDTYYPTIQEAFDDVDEKDWEDNTVWLLRDTTEYPVNNTPDAFTFNLDGHTVTGTIINSTRGKITLVNGRVEAEADHDEAFINNGLLNLGIHDGTVEVDNSIALVGNAYGLVNKRGSKFYFYDGYLQGKSGLVGGYTGKEEHHYVFVNHIADRDCQKVYLVKNPSRAVAKTLTNAEHGVLDGDVYYYNLQDGINTVAANKKEIEGLDDTDYILYAIRDFEAAYELEVKEEERIFIDLVGYEVQIGKKILNNGYLNLYNDKELRTTVKPSMTFENHGELIINNINVVMTTDAVGVTNNGKLDVSNTSIHAKNNNAVYNAGEASIIFDRDTELYADTQYAIHNLSPNLVINHGTIRGLLNNNNHGTVEVTGDAKFTTYKIPDVYEQYIPAIRNNGVMKQTGAEVKSDCGAAALYNPGTYNISAGSINSTNLSVNQYVDLVNGTINISGGEVSGTNTTISSGTINITNNAELTSQNGPASSNATLNIYSGKVYVDRNNTVSYGNVYVYGGELIGIDNAATGLGTFYIESGKVTSEAGGITCSNAVIKGGEVDIYNTAITTSSLSMTGGLVKSQNGTGIIVNSSGLMTGGKIVGDIYGLRSNGELTIGVDEGDISSEIPEIVGGSFGLYITGPITNFFDGILKGQIDGYNEELYDGFEKGRITGTPLGATIGEGEEEIDGDLYQTDFIIRYENWLKIGETEYNTINAASQDCPENDECLITVIKDAYPTFAQTFIDENNNKNITFDLNGHKISGTQTIYNNSTVTIVDSSDEKTGTIEPDRVPVITNTNKLILEAGNYKAYKATSAIHNRQGQMIINHATFRSSTSGIENAAYLRINDIDMESTNIGIKNIEYLVGYTTVSSGSIDMYDGTIKATNIGISAGASTIHIHDGLIEANSGISGSNGTLIMSGGTVHGKTGKALENYWGNIEIHAGEVLADNDIAVQTAASTFMDGGHVKGTTGIEHKVMCNGVYCWWNPETIEGGVIEGTVNHGLIGHGSNLTVTGGEIYGEIDGVQNIGSTGRFGNDEGSISTSVPLIQGKRYGLYTESYMMFYDGILKGKTAAHTGLITQIPDATMIKDDYEFINRERYETQYLVEFGDWLQVGDQKFNTLTTACSYAANGGTVSVIADAYVNFYQALPRDKNITLDLNGHSVVMTIALDTLGTDTILDSKGTGRLHNVRTNAVVNGATLTIESGNFSSDATYAIQNNGTMTVNDITLNTYGGISTGGTLTFNGGTVNGTSARGIISSGYTVINGGYIHSDTNTSLEVPNGTTVINSGEIVNNVTNGILVTNGGNQCGNLTVNGGEITGELVGVLHTSSCALNITGGHIYSPNGLGVKTESYNAHITGGIIEGSTYGLYTIGTTTLGDDDGTLSIDLPVIKGDTYGLYIEQGTLNFYDGILKGITASNYGQITNIPNRAQIFIDEETIDNKHYETKYLIMETDLAKNLNTGKIYSNFQDSLDEAQDNEVVQLLTNVPLYYAVTNNNTHHFTLDMNGYTISTNKPITNKGTLTIRNSNTEKESIIKTSTAMTLLTNNNTLYLENITLRNTSSDRYVLYSNNTLSMTGTNIEAINGVQNTGTATINNATITASSTAIDNTGIVKVDGGTYKGGYSFYSNSSYESKTENATFIGTFYNNRGILRVNNCVVTRNYEQSFQNNGTIYVYESEVNGDGLFSNSGTMELEKSLVNSTGYYRWDSRVSGINNTGNLRIINSELHFDEDAGQCSEAYGVTTSGIVNIEQNSLISVGAPEHTNTNWGIRVTGNGNATVDDSEIIVNGGSTSYGIYVVDSGSHATVLTGKVEVKDARVAYGGYANYGTFTIGHYEGVEAESELVSDTNPIIYASGSTRGIGVKKVNGQFEFYDGIVWGSRYAKPETTTLVEKLYEVTTYVDQDTGYEYAVLEFMGLDYQGKPTALFHNVYYQSLQEAIDVYYKYEGEEIKLLKPVAENLNVRLNEKAIINLNGYSVTGKVTNNGELQVYNGSIQSFQEVEIDEETGEVIPITPTVINNGTFIMGLDDNKVSSTNTRVISEGLAIENNNIFKMYDGYIEGNPTIDGDIQEIADFARIHTVNETQYERKYLQSLDENAIRRKETALIVTIDPLSGFYDNRQGEQHFYMFYEDTMEIKKPTKRGCDFVEWVVSEPTAYQKIDDPEGKIDGILTIDVKDIKLTASWVISERAVAKIGDEYYESLVEALEAAKAGDTIELLKDVEEDITVTKEVTINLGGHTVTGAFINQGILTIFNGEINNPDGIGLLNLKTLTMGVLTDGEVQLDTVRIIGTELGLQQDGRFNFYDGYIEGEVSMNGIAHSLPKGFSLYTEHNDISNKQRLFLSGNPENAVASITSGEATQFFFKLTDAIATAKMVNKEIKIERDFEAAYEIRISEDANIVINMNSHDITTGNNIINEGELLLYDNSEDSGSITSARSITNEGKMTIQGIKLHQTKSVDTLINNGELIITDNVVDEVSYPAIIEATDKFAVVNNGDLILLGNYELNSTSQALKQNGTMNEVSTGKIHGIWILKDTSLKDDVYINWPLRGAANSTTLNLKDMSVNVPNESCIYTSGVSNMNINLDNVTMNCQYGIYTYSGSGMNINVKDSNITTSAQGYRIATSSSTLVSNNTNVTSGSHAVLNESIKNTYTLNGNYISTSTIAVYDDYNTNSCEKYYYFTGGYVEGQTHGVYLRSFTATVSNTEIKTTSTNRDHYAFYVPNWSVVTLQEGAFLNAPYASGFRSSSTLYMDEGSKIYAGANNAYGIWSEYLNSRIDGEIITPGPSAIGILANYDESNIIINSGVISSGNVGIQLNATNSSYNHILNMYGGSITGKTYGIYMTEAHTVTIGNVEDEDNQHIPLVSGGTYGIYRSKGTVLFYNGRLRGSTFGYYNPISIIKPGKEITTVHENIDATLYDTVSTTDLSTDPISNTAKLGNGAARLTYLGEDTGVCVYDESVDFEYTGSETTYTVPCTGKYKLEVWGAQGGGTNPDANAGSRSGAGGYATGMIDFVRGEKIYINVGGRGVYGSGQSSYGGPVGGYNGGGNGGNYGSGSGGGATHIATKSGLLSSLERNKDTVLIVAGGGGGSDDAGSARGGANDGSGGSGGGYAGGQAIIDGTKQNGYEGYHDGGSGFGKAINVTNNTDTGGAGGGWYSGYPTNHNNGGGGGGSGYIGHERIYEGIMYGYDLPIYETEWISNYLINKDDFLQVGDKTFNTFTDAIAEIPEDGTGTIILLKDSITQDVSTFVAGKTITFDLNGHTLQTTKRLYNKGNLTIIDSSVEKTGKLEALLDDTIQNDGNITIDGIIIDHKDTATSAIYLCSGSGNAIIKNSTITSVGNGVWSNSNQHVTFNNNTMTVDGVGIRFNNTDSSLDTDGSTITSKGAGIHINSGHRSSIYIHDIDLTSTGDRAIYIYGEKNTLTIDDGTIQSTANHGIDIVSYNSNRNTFTMNGGHVIGADDGAVIHSCNAEIKAGTIETTINNRDRYAIHQEYYSNLKIYKDAIIKAETASGIMTNDPITIDGATIIANHTSAYGIYDYAGNSTYKDVTITTPGASSYGIMYAINNSNYTVDITNSTITSGNVGLYLGAGTRTININSGTINGTNTAVYQNSGGMTVNIGKATDELNTEDPHLVSDNIVYSKNRGTTNFYNGRLTSKSIIANSNFNSLRKDMQIKYEYTYTEGELLSLSLSNTSDDALPETPKEGNGYARITMVENSNTISTANYETIDDVTINNVNKVYYPSNTDNTETVNYSYTGGVQSFTAPSKGIYKIELWGGSGENNAYGGYTSGNIILDANQTVYIYVGNKYTSGGNKMQFMNGAGNDGGYNGGGATDVRLVSGDWNNFDSLKSRIMVAGAGGCGSTPGAGGGLSGYSGNGTAGGTQTTYGTAQSTSYTTSSFGVANGGCTGGSGYYPGGGAACASGAGGGSSFISGHPGCDAIAETSTSNNIIHTASPNHYSGLVFGNTEMIDGQGYEWNTGSRGNKTLMPNISGDGTMTGNSGSGYAKISRIDQQGKSYIYLVNDYVDIYENIYEIDTGSTLPNLPAVEVDGLEFVGWFLDKDHTKKVTNTTTYNVGTYLYAYYLPTDTYCDSLLNQEINFNFTGSTQEFVVNCKGKYKLEVWGAQGGYAGSEAISGGPGGYSRGYINLNDHEKLYISVGEQGKPNINQESFNIFNGGGLGRNDNGSTYAGCGGGATHIATTTGELKTLSSLKHTVLIVAGGGGGASNHGTSSTTLGAGGGGIAGANGTSQQWKGGGGGTQTAGGARGHSSAQDGSFGKGGNGVANAGGGGGAGWYGGGGGNGGSGGGGSGYIGNTRLFDAMMAGYNTPGSGYSKIEAYLEDKTGFLEVNNVVYNSFEKALAAISSEGTIKVIGDSAVTEVITIPEGMNITLDLNNKKLNLTKTIINNGTLTITDNSGSIGELKNSVASSLINNYGILTVNKAKISAYDHAINGSSTTGKITTNKDVYIEATIGIHLDVKHDLTVNGTTMNVSSYGIYNAGDGSTIHIIDTNITSKYDGIRIYNHNTTTTIDDCNIIAGRHGVYNYGQSNVFTMNGGYIKSTSTYALINDNSCNSNYLPKFYIYGGKLESTASVAYIYYGTLYIKNAELFTTSTSRDTFAVYGRDYVDVYVQEGGFINAPYASGVNTNGGVHLNGGRIYAGHNSAYGIRGDYMSIHITSGSLETPGGNAYGLSSASNNRSTLSMTGGSITSGNIGVYLTSTNNTRTIDIKGGTIYGESYGIYQTQDYTTTIGDSEQVVSTTSPLISGGLYGIYKTAGSMSFYSGRLKGSVAAYVGSFNNIRSEYEVFETTEELSAEDLKKKTISTSDVSSDAISNYAKAGDGYARVTYINNDSDKLVTDVSDINSNITEDNSIINIPFTGEEYKFTADRNGQYLLRVWGAQGGNAKGYYYSYTGGYGGYSEGTITLNKGENLYVNVGGQGDDITERCVITENGRGYNGGGRASCQGSSAYGTNYNNYLFGGGSGGATHIARSSGKLSTLEKYKGVISSDEKYYESDNIIIVAAGGGGSTAAASTYGSNHVGNGGHGGGYIGNTGDNAPASSGYWGGKGASQTEAGINNNQGGTAWITPSAFGQGCVAASENSGHLKVSAGGGFFGGGCGNHSGGGGGSGYIANSSLTNAHMTCYNCATTEEEKIKTQKTLTVSGTPIVDTAKQGNGYAQIIYLGDEPLSNETYTVKLSTKYGTITNNVLTYNANEQLGTITAPVVEDENLEFVGWFLDSEYTKKVSSTTTINSNCTLYAKFSYRSDYCTSLINTKYNFEYTGGEQTLDITCPGTYKLEVWGAQGGGVNVIPDGIGAGGYSVGTIELETNERLYINVGGQGSYGNTGSVYGGPRGGYNGGGNGGNSGSGSGGGATHIATVSGTLPTLKGYQDKVLIVAGGGGGTDDTTVGSDTYVNDGAGGSGGGFIGGSPKVTSSIAPGYGGNQTYGGAFGQGQHVSSNTDTGGGGGGWYGGLVTNNNNGGGGGGSGYTGNARLTDTCMYTYNNTAGFNQNNIAYLIPVTDKVVNKTTNTRYSNIQTALEQAVDEDVLELLGDGSIANELITPNKEITLDLHGYTLTTNKTITNNGKLSIVDLTNSGNSKLINTVTTGFIINNKEMAITGVKLAGNEVINNKVAGTLTLDHVDITQSTTGIINAGELNIDTVNITTSSYGINNTGIMTINNISVSGGTYGIYSGSTGISTVRNSILHSSTAVYLNSSGKVTFTGSYKSIGAVTVGGSGSTLVISPAAGSTITGEITNYGKTNITGMSISYTVAASGSYAYINNHGELTFDTNAVTLTNTYNSSNSYWDAVVRNYGTFKSISNTYTFDHAYNNKDTYVLMNYGIMNSTNDTITGSGSNNMMAFYNNTNNSAEIRNITATLTSPNNAYGLYNIKGAFGISGGTMNVKATNNQGLHLEAGTVAAENLNLNAVGTGENRGAYVKTGTLNVLSGNYIAKGGTVAYGIQLIDGELNLGNPEDSVSITTPFVEATGSTTGIGVSMGEGDYNYYDGKVAGNTNYKVDGDITTYVDPLYQVKEGTYFDPETEIEYKYCILEIIY